MVLGHFGPLFLSFLCFKCFGDILYNVSYSGSLVVLVMSFFYSLFSSLSIRFPPVSLSFSVPLHVSVFMWVVFVSFLLPYSSPCVSPAYHVNPCSPDHHVSLFCSLTNVPSLSLSSAFPHSVSSLSISLAFHRFLFYCKSPAFDVYCV